MTFFNETKNSDEIIGHECSTDCNILFDMCKRYCNENIECLIECDYDLESCISACPCHGDCIDGCSGCESPYCVCYGDSEDEEKKECLDKLDQVYVSCLVNCEHEVVCVSKCVREYNEGVLECPCNEGCPQGCPCPNYECSTETTTEPTTTTVPNYGGLVLAVYDKDAKATLTNSDGEIFDMEWENTGSVSAYGFCSLIYQNEHYMFG